MAEQAASLYAPSSSSPSLGPSSLSRPASPPLSELQVRRAHYYREALEHVDVRYLDEQERLIRHKVTSRVKGSNFRLRSTFRYFDRDAKGVEKADVKMIDFAKTGFVAEGSLDHRTAWVLGNHEEGYLTGLDSLISTMEELSSVDVS